MAGFAGDEATVRAALADDDEGVRAAALGALVRLGRATAGDAAGAIGDASPVVRKRAAELAAALEAADFLPLLEDEDPTVVEAGCFALGEVREAAAVGRLAEIAVSHDDALCRESAVAALGAIGDPAGLPAVLAALRDKPAVRRRAVIALAPFDGPEVDGALRRALDDRDWQVRQAAEDLLSPAAEPAAIAEPAATDLLS